MQGAETDVVRTGNMTIVVSNRTVGIVGRKLRLMPGNKFRCIEQLVTRHH